MTTTTTTAIRRIGQVAALTQLAVLTLVTAGPAHAAGLTGGCIDVPTSGKPLPSYACLTEKVQATTSSLSGPPSTGLRATPMLAQPSQQIGLVNWTDRAPLPVRRVAR